MKTIPIQIEWPRRDTEFDRVMTEAVRSQADQPGALLPLLHWVQDRLGHIPAEAIPIIAHALNLSRAEVHGVVSYYPHFRSQPPGRLHLQICLAEACLAQGAQALAVHAQGQAACALHETRADSAVSLEPVYCLGLCATGPAVMINDRPRARVTVEWLSALIDRALGSTEDPSGGGHSLCASAEDPPGACK